MRTVEEFMEAGINDILAWLESRQPTSVREADSTDMVLDVQ